MDNENECCCTGECKAVEPSYNELERELDKAKLQLNLKDNLIEGLQNAIITNTCRIRDLETDREYWRNRYYNENERAGKLLVELREFKEGKN